MGGVWVCGHRKLSSQVRFIRSQIVFQCLEHSHFHRFYYLGKKKKKKLQYINGIPIQNLLCLD